MLAQLVTSFLAAAAFGVLFNTPKESLIKAGFVGMIGWIVYYGLVEWGVNKVLATLVAAFFVGGISHFFAKRYKTPIIIFTVSGIIPLVPGGLAYYSTKSLVENHYNLAASYATQVLMFAGAIALGLILAEVMNQLMMKYHKRKRKLLEKRV